MELTSLGSSSLKEAVASLEVELERLDHLYRPASTITIIKTLAGMGSLFGAPPPDQVALDLYVASLSRLPRQVFAAARDKLVASHKYPNLPKPADFLEAGQPEQDRISAVYRVVSGRLSSYKRALSMLH